MVRLGVTLRPRGEAPGASGERVPSARLHDCGTGAGYRGPGESTGRPPAIELWRPVRATALKRHEIQALREVSDALLGFQQSRELLASHHALLTAAAQARALAEFRYQSDTSSYLEVLDSNSRRLDAEFALVRARLDALLSYVEVYRALRRGWQV
jgi:hypothetical protein